MNVLFELSQPVMTSQSPGSTPSVKGACPIFGIPSSNAPALKSASLSSVASTTSNLEVPPTTQ